MDTVLLLKFFSAFVFVICLMLLFSWAVKKMGLSGEGLVGKEKNKRRLKVIESMALDARRRLVLVRRDDKEHLLVLGQDGETVVETGIEAKQGAEDDHVVAFTRDHRNVKI